MKVLPRALTAPITFVTAAVTATLSGWFAKRAPKNDSTTLNLRNVYIFFSREGLLFAVLLIITFVAGINYGNNLVLGLCFYLISVWLVSVHITFAHLSGLQVRLLDVTVAEAGALVWVTLQLRSESKQPRRQLVLSFDQGAEQALKASKKARKKNLQTHSQENKINSAASSKVVVASLQDEQTIRMPVFTERRGQFELPRLQIKTVYPLGIMRAWSYVYFARTTWVYPKPLAFDWQVQHSAASLDELPTAGHYKQQLQGQDDFERLDNYIEGESLAQISWAHLARGQGMLTKHFADPIGHELMLDYSAMPAANHEQKLAQLAYGAITLGKLNVPFQLQLPNDTHTKPVIGHGESFTQVCLLRLAKAP